MLIEPHLPVGLGLLGQLRFDLTHLRQTERLADASGVDVILGRQHHGDENHHGRGPGDHGRPDKLLRAREFVEAGFFCVEHMDISCRFRRPRKGR